MPGPLRILLADSGSGRAAIIEQRLRELGDAVVLRVPVAGRLARSVRDLGADVVIIDVACPDRDGIDELKRVSADNPRPMVLFVDRDDSTFMEEAIAAGVTSYNVTGADIPDLKPIVTAAIAIFRKHQGLADDLVRARAIVVERETINRAKSLLMRQRNIDEPQAYRWLQRRAMNESRRIAEVAAEMIVAEGDAPKQPNVSAPGCCNAQKIVGWLKTEQ